MDLDGRSGNQGLKEKNVAPNSLTILELHYDGTTAIRGFGAKLEYDPGLVEVVLDEYETHIGEGSAVLDEYVAGAGRDGAGGLFGELYSDGFGHFGSTLPAVQRNGIILCGRFIKYLVFLNPPSGSI
jgi:hypothetical protein